MQRTLEELLPISQGIYGAIFGHELDVLYKYAHPLSRNSVIVEIGSYCGKSSSMLGMVAMDNGCQFYCVDIFMDPAPGVEKGKPIKNRFIYHMLDNNIKYTLYEEPSWDAVRHFEDESIDLLFVDGDHSKHGINEDCKVWPQKVKHGGIIIFHDYNSSWLEIKMAVDKLSDLVTVDAVDSIIVKRKA